MPADLEMILDPTDEAEVKAAFDTLGALRGLVVLPKASEPALFEDLGWDEWKSTLSAQLDAPLLSLKHAQVEEGGAIVLGVSVPASPDAQQSVADQAAMGGIVGLMRATSGEFAPSGVRVNVVCADMQSGPPENIAEAILFLLSDQAAFVTGTELVVGGA
jgi:NAD(P)-dependent dehydrogenase (short-subunit alcohol dehydrogenase family)